MIATDSSSFTQIHSRIRTDIATIEWVHMRLIHRFRKWQLALHTIQVYLWALMQRHCTQTTNSKRKNVMSNKGARRPVLAFTKRTNNTSSTRGALADTHIYSVCKTSKLLQKYEFEKIKLTQNDLKSCKRNKPNKFPIDYYYCLLMNVKYSFYCWRLLNADLSTLKWKIAFGSCTDTLRQKRAKLESN